MTRRTSVPLVLVACLAWIGCSDADIEAESGNADPDAAAVPLSNMQALSLDSLLDAGIELYYDWEFDSAQVVFDAVLAEAESRGNRPVYARALTWMGLRAWRQGDYAEANALGEAALAYKLDHELNDQLFRSYNALGLVAWYESRLGAATQRFQEAVLAARAVGDRSSEAAGLGNLALVQTDFGEFSAAREGFSSMLAVGTDLADTLKMANALTNLGMLDILLGDPATAIPRLTEARQLYRDAEYVGHEENPVAQLGTAYASLGDLGRAHAMFDTALALATENEDPQAVAANTVELAEVYRQAGDYSRALELFSEARRLDEELGLQLEMGADLRSEAEVYAALGELDIARERAAEALEIHREIGASFEELRDLVTLAEVLQLAGRPVEAKRYLDDAQEIAETLDARAARILIWLTRARLRTAADQPRGALGALAELDADLDRSGFSTQWEVEALRADAYLALGDLRSAISAGTRAVEAVERVRETIPAGVLRSSYAAARTATYATLIEALLRNGDKGRAFQVADAARSRALVEGLSQTRGGSAANPEISTILRGEELLRRIDRLVSSLDTIQLAAAGGSGDLVATETRDRERRIAEARDEYAATIEELERSTEARRALLVGRADIRSIQAALAGDEALIEYFVTPERLLIFVVTRDELQVAASDIPSENLASRVRLARELLGDPDAPPDRSTAVLGRLYEVLVAPAIRTAAIQGTRRLVIVPHESLTYLPFAALLDPVTGRRLVEDYSLQHVPSAAALPTVRRRGAGGGMAVSIAVSRVFAPFPEELPASLEEASAVEASFGDARLAVGEQASEAELRQALAEDGVVHVATHGVMNPRNPMMSRIELAAPRDANPDDDGRLEVHELLLIDVGAPLVFLSGCETGLGPAWSSHYARGADFATLAQALLYAGAGNVIASLWRLEDSGAARFAALFYQELQGASPVEALANAQRRMLRDGRYGSPYYWAAYRLSGYGL